LKIAIHQPNFFPYPGFFHKLINVDTLVLLDNVQFEFDLTNRNKIISKNNEEEIIDVKGPEHLFFFEAELASQSIAKEKVQAPHPAMSWEDTLGNLKALDQWRDKVNYKLPQDE